MAHQFKVGDRVRIVDGRRRGVVATVISPLRPCRINEHSGWYGRFPSGEPMHDLDLEPRPGCTHVAYPPHYLRPFYDGNEKALDVEAWIADLCKAKDNA